MEESVEIYSKLKSIKKIENEDVYCIYVPSNNSFITNNIVSHNCDALRYVLASHKVATYQPFASQQQTSSFPSSRYEPTASFIR